VLARPRDDGRYEIRLSFVHDRPKEELQFIPFSTEQNYILDYWFQLPHAVPAPRVAKRSVTASAKNAKAPAKASVGEPAASASDAANPAAKAPLVKPNGAELGLDFEDQNSWEKILGSTAVAIEFNSEELARFRLRSIERNSGLPATPVELRPLRLPMMDIPPLQANLIFLERKPQFGGFHLAAPADEKEDEALQRRATEQGLNLIVSLVSKRDFLRARQAIDVLERSPQAKRIPWGDPQWWALKGYVLLEVGRELGDSLQDYRAVELWRDGLRATATRADSSSRPYLEYMANEAVRLLFKQDLVYAASALLSWSRRISWSAATEERFAYLRAEALYRLGFVEETRKAFQEFLSARLDLPISAMSDRRLLPAAAFRLGDLEMKHGNFKEAIQQYTAAFTSGPKARKFSFEGNLLPEDIRLFPYTLFNRAEAFIRLGYEERALKDLRAFMYAAPSDPDAGLVFFRLGDIMRFLGAPERSVAGAWRECIYKVPATLGAHLCAARKAADDMVTADESLWPRLIAEVEDARAQQKSAYRGGIPDDEMWTYLNLLLADTFVRLQRPYQALVRLDSVATLEVSPYLKTWWREYTVTAYVGHQNRMIEEKRYREVLRDYEKRRTMLFLEQTRPEVLRNLARALRGLNLLKEARETLAEAEKLRAKFPNAAPRPFMPSEQEWLAVRVDLDLEALEHRLPEVTAAEVGTRIAKLDLTNLEHLRLRLRYAEITHDPAAQVAEWARIEAQEGLAWPELVRYVGALKAAKQSARLDAVIEARAGAWFAEKDKPTAAAAPPAGILFELFEARERGGQHAAALTVADYLTSLDDKTLGNDVTKPMVAYKRGRILQKLGRDEEARQSFAEANRLSPDSVWGKLASSAQKDMRAR
jgi:tetratricopeptide (TPR) repeat protein